MFNLSVSNIIGTGAISIANKTLEYAAWCIKSHIIGNTSLDCIVTTMRQRSSNATDMRMSFTCNTDDVTTGVKGPHDILRHFIGAPNSDFHECTPQETLTFSNATSTATRLIRDHYTDAGEHFAYDMDYCKITECNLTALYNFASNMANTASSADENNSAYYKLLALILGVTSIAGSIALYCLYYKKNKTGSIAITGVDVGTNANTGVKNFNAETMPKDFQDNNDNHHYEEPYALNNHTDELNHVEAAYESMKLGPISGQDAIRAEAV
ncbi:hypothetical protein [Orientia tsutsugamushi]|uniref:Uncharacterized protein n=1 Tax=Orientia tsutsugamushi TaxID=784 RepID=A0A2U3R7N1_ORITS|nr:hypothetical protein [Orientia tsutsugamushi]KJV51741.1 hypothetical protein OTSKATO_1463 [Orientia tsutsugamushi str. Kato PP]SPR09180.1 Uncharacterised protein [Orientia tsutsugamushi]